MKQIKNLQHLKDVNLESMNSYLHMPKDLRKKTS